MAHLNTRNGRLFPTTGCFLMAKAAKTAWGIDVGNCTLKAIKLADGPDGVEVLDFAVVEHKKILSQPDLNTQERNELIDQALTTFLEEHDLGNSSVVVSVSGHSSFARFIKLPPVESKRIPELVRYEAIQQIPFDINDVEWDWQTFQNPDNPDIEVGIFAIKRDLVLKALQPFTQADCVINTVQMAPMALYNFLMYDQKHLRTPDANEAIITLDIGAENTDLIIADGIHVWQRSIPIGGNQFTAAIQKAFKLSFPKAEAIKRTASTSKYARQIFRAMRSVFADLAAEIQRSLGFYSSGKRDVQFREVLALGNAIKLPGLVKFLQQSLSLPVKRLDSFELLKLSSEVSVTQFAAHLPTLGVAYGLALQEIGLGQINVNLLPREVIRQTLWQRKRRWFVAACAVFVLAGLMCFFKAYAQRIDIRSEETGNNRKIIDQAENKVSSYQNKYNHLTKQIKQAQEKITQLTQVYKPHNLIPEIYYSILEALPNAQNNPDPKQKECYEAFNKGDRDALIATMQRNLRQQVFVSSIQMVYTNDLNRSFADILKNSSRGAGSSSGSSDSSGLSARPPSAFRPGASGFAGSSARQTPKTGTAAPTGLVQGFAVVIEGSTPNKDHLSFLHPPEVGLDRGKWGFFNRLENLGLSDEEILARANPQTEQPKKTAAKTASFKPQSKPSEQPAVNLIEVPDNPQQKAQSDAAGKLPFETYIGPGDRMLYFDTAESGWVRGNPDALQPPFLGVLKREDTKMVHPPGSDRLTSATSASLSMRTNLPALPVLLDPFTGEVISETYLINPATGQEKLDSQGKPIIAQHDYWFRIRFKIKLQDTDKSDQPTAAKPRRTGF